MNVVKKLLGKIHLDIFVKEFIKNEYFINKISEDELLLLKQHFLRLFSEKLYTQIRFATKFKVEPNKSTKTPLLPKDPVHTLINKTRDNIHYIQYYIVLVEIVNPDINSDIKRVFKIHCVGERFDDDSPSHSTILDMDNLIYNLKWYEYIFSISKPHTDSIYYLRNIDIRIDVNDFKQIMQEERMKLFKEITGVTINSYNNKILSKLYNIL